MSRCQRVPLFINTEDNILYLSRNVYLLQRTMIEHRFYCILPLRLQFEDWSLFVWLDRGTNALFSNRKISVSLINISVIHKHRTRRARRWNSSSKWLPIRLRTTRDLCNINHDTGNDSRFQNKLRSIDKNKSSLEQSRVNKLVRTLEFR